MPLAGGVGAGALGLALFEGASGTLSNGLVGCCGGGGCWGCCWVWEAGGVAGFWAGGFCAGDVDCGAARPTSELDSSAKAGAEMRGMERQRLAASETAQDGIRRR